MVILTCIIYIVDGEGGVRHEIRLELHVQKIGFWTCTIQGKHDVGLELVA